MKYIIDVPDEAVGCMDGEMSFFVEPKIKDERRRHYVLRIDEEDVFIYIEPNRKAIEDEVWKFLAFLIDEMDADDKYECFGMSSAYKIVRNMSYNEAKARYEAWLKQKDKIHVGDEVTFEMAFGNGLDNNMKAVALDQAATGEEWCVLTENGCVETHDEEDLYKTGRHFDEVGQMLEKMRGEEG